LFPAALRKEPRAGN